MRKFQPFESSIGKGEDQTWQLLDLADDSVSQALPLGFEFSFFDHNYTSIRVSSSELYDSDGCVEESLHLVVTQVSSNGWATFLEGEDWAWCTTNYFVPGFGINSVSSPKPEDEIKVSSC